MKKTMLFVSAVLLVSASSAFAAAQPVVVCNTAAGTPDRGTSVVIKEIAPMVVGLPKTLIAEVSTTTIAGKIPFDTFTVRELQSARVGAPRMYKGTDFELTINVDTQPTRDGIRSHVVADSNKSGRRISEDLGCRMVR